MVSRYQHGPINSIVAKWQEQDLAVYKVISMSADVQAYIYEQVPRGWQIETW